MLNQDQLKALFDSIDAKDAETFASFISEKGRFVYGAQMDVAGRTAITEAVGGFFGTLDRLSHSNLQAWAGDDGKTQFVYGDVHYVLPNGNEVDIAFLNRFTFEGGELVHYHVFTDPTPLFTAAQG
ncbi:nuclear transport factor 2 family protein [bacterium]|nr:nuclear transport factor 2 family protein [bacterium]